MANNPNLVPVAQLIAPQPVTSAAPKPEMVPVTPDQHLFDLNSRMAKMEAEGRVLTKAGGVGTDDYNKLVKQHRDLRGQQRFLQRAYVKPSTSPLDEHPIAALDRLRQEGGN